MAAPPTAHVAHAGAGSLNLGVLSVTTVGIGNNLVMTMKEPVGVHITALAGGGVTSWNKGVLVVGVSRALELWFGTVTAVGTANLNFTYSGVPGANCDLNADEFSGGTSWSLRAVGGQDNASSVACALPSLICPSDTNDGYLYTGCCQMANSFNGGLTAGFTNVATALGGEVVYAESIAAGSTNAPSFNQSVAGDSTSVAAIFSTAIDVVQILDPVARRFF